MDIDYEKIEPFTLMQKLKGKKDTLRIQKLLDLDVFKVRDGILVVPYFKCIKIDKNNKHIKEWFPFSHQVFWYLLKDTRDLDYAISELIRVLNGEKQYLFPNGTLVKIDLGNSF